jgi:hypothetical protein
VDRIKSGIPFSLARYGDGEWSAILNDRRLRTGSGSQALNIPALRRDLRRGITQRPKTDNYFMALRESSIKRSVKQWLNKHAGGIPWHDCTVFYKASKKGWLNPLIKAFRESELPKIVVGPPWLHKVNRIFPVAVHVRIPARDCYTAKKRIVKQVLAFGKPAIISISAGPTGKVLVRELFWQLGQQSFIIDFGSLWDVYCGRLSRQYMQTMTTETIAKNLRR